MSSKYRELNGKYQLILPASEIPHEYEVTKPTGTYAYILIKKGVVLHTSEGKSVTCANSLLLFSERNYEYTVIQPEEKLKLHFDSMSQLYGFIDMRHSHH